MILSVVVAAVLAMEQAPMNCDVHRGTVHSLDPQRLYRTARSASMVIADGRRIEIVDEAWLRRLHAGVNHLPSLPKQRLRGDIRLVVVLECDEGKPIQLALRANCGAFEINSALKPYDPELFDLVLERVHDDHQRSWASVAAFCKQQLKRSKPSNPQKSPHPINLRKKINLGEDQMGSNEIQMEGGRVMEELVVCCFCGKSLRAHGSVLLLLHPPEEREEAQSLYAHRGCLVEKLHPSVPLHPDLMEDEDPGRS